MGQLRILHPLGWSSGYDDDEMMPDYTSSNAAEHDQPASTPNPFPEGGKAHSPNNKPYSSNNKTMAQSQSININITHAADFPASNSDSTTKMVSEEDRSSPKERNLATFGELYIIAAVLTPPNKILESTINATREGRLDPNEVKLQVAGIKAELDRIINSKYFGQFESLKDLSVEDEMIARRKQHGPVDKTTLDDDRIDNEEEASGCCSFMTYIVGMILTAMAFLLTATVFMAAALAFSALGLAIGFLIGYDHGMC